MNEREEGERAHEVGAPVACRRDGVACPPDLDRENLARRKGGIAKKSTVGLYIWIFFCGREGHTVVRMGIKFSVYTYLPC